MMPCFFNLSVVRNEIRTRVGQAALPARIIPEGLTDFHESWYGCFPLTVSTDVSRR